MQNEELGVKTAKGIFWHFLEKAGAGLVNLAVFVILARILLPEDYDVVVLATVFVAFFGIFFNYGLSHALIKKENTDDVDYSTVFYTETVLSVFFYVALFFLAPLFAGFFNCSNPELLVSVIRVLAFKIPVFALSSVQYSILAKNLEFKKFFYISLIGTLISAVVGIVMAFTGFGVWALVAAGLTDSFIDMIFLFVFSKWKPKLKFSFSRLKELFAYGYKYLLVGIIDTAYSELREIVIGRRYTPEDLSYFSQGRKYPRFLVSNINSSIAGVLFPAFASVSSSKETLKEEARKALNVISYLLFPCVAGLAVIGESFIKILLTDAWLGALPFLYIYLAVAFFSPIHTVNSQMIKALNKSSEYLITEIIKRAIGVIALIISVNFGVLYIALSSVAVTFLTAVMNVFINKKLIGYTVKEQFADLLPNVLIALIMGGVCYSISFIPVNYVIITVIQIVLGVILYFTLSAAFKLKAYITVKDTLKKIFKKGKND